MQDAKNQLSELLETVRKNGAQTNTRHGKPGAVVVSAENYARLQPQEKLMDMLRDYPVKEWTAERDASSARNIRFQ